MRVLALDVGSKRIGVAVSDPTGLIATPLTTISRSGGPEDVEEVLRLTSSHQAVEILVGLPLSLSGRMGPQAESVAQFTRELSERSPVQVKSVDERFSSVQAERLLRQSGKQPSRARALVDAAAAAVILQSYLDSQRREPPVIP